MLGDNQAMYKMVTQEGATSRTRYYERATMLIKRAVLMLLLQPYLIGTTNMIADLFTKALDKGQFYLFTGVPKGCPRSFRRFAPLRGPARPGARPDRSRGWYGTQTERP